MDDTMPDPGAHPQGAAIDPSAGVRERDGQAVPAPHGRRDPLDREEREIKDNVLRLGSLVADQIVKAIDALESHDAALATEVIVGDGRLNEAQRLITALVTRTIATQQPVARDLRFLLALDHVAYDLDRKSTRLNSSH